MAARNHSVPRPAGARRAAAPGPTLVSLRGLGLVHDDGTEVLRDIDLDVEKGALTTLIGASGVGKTTLLRVVAGLAAPTCGDIRHHEALAPGDIGYVFQDPTLMPWADVTGNVRLPMRLLGRGRGETAIAAGHALEMVGMAGEAARMPGELSGGMRMRVAVARALVTGPRLLLMDEPFAALDEPTRNRLAEDLRQIMERTGLTILFVTHSIAEAVFLSDRIVLLAGRPARVVERLENPDFAGDVTRRHSARFTRMCRSIAEYLAY